MCWRDKTLRFKIELNLRHLGVSSMGFGLWLNLLHFINTRMYIGVDVCMCIKKKTPNDPTVYSRDDKI